MIRTLITTNKQHRHRRIQTKISVSLFLVYVSCIVYMFILKIHENFLISYAWGFVALVFTRGSKSNRTDTQVRELLRFSHRSFCRLPLQLILAPKKEKNK